MFNRKQSFVKKHENILVATATIIGSGIAAYFGSRKAVADVVESAATAVVGAVQNMQVPVAAPAQPAAQSVDICDVIEETINNIDAAIAADAKAKAAKAEAEAPKAKQSEAKKAEPVEQAAAK